MEEVADPIATALGWMLMLIGGLTAFGFAIAFVALTAFTATQWLAQIPRRTMR